MKYFLIILLAFLLVSAAVYYFINQEQQTYTKEETGVEIATSTEQAEVKKEEIATTTKTESVNNKSESVIGKSIQGNEIKAFHFGNGTKELLFIGGIHGGYSWNTALVGFEAIDWFKKNNSIIPKDVKVTVIPILNPDGLKKVTGTTEKFTASQVNQSSTVQTEGRFNANGVDLNRNFACEWQATGMWQDKEVSGGKEAFSEPEAQAIKNYVTKNKPLAIVTWYSAEGSVYTSDCQKGILPETQTLTDLYAKASGYKSEKNFDHYALTGDMVNWFASQNIPAISVLLTTHDQTEWNKNQAGIEAILKHYTE
ncbi:MAG: Gamma-D-glutamyl-L-diamino acid endopeptidase 1 [Parcubacteria bacterium OLB19]|nr:MAG: Gamma-D-glutamyl-L-diamino acid endopeptidase 1 [Parcubacteria bacterium OLB19]